jgi:SH3-like domain-containing protein
VRFITPGPARINVYSPPMRRLSVLSIALLLALLAPAIGLSVPAARAADTEETGSGLPIPRFVSLRADEVNLRAGPGVRYPIDWVYQRRLMPVMVVEEFDTWRKIRDWQGTEGWVNKAMLSGRRMALVTGEIRTLRREPSAESPAVARAEPGVIGRLVKCKDTWCKLDAGGHEGWIPRGEIWGVQPDEKIE